MFQVNWAFGATWTRFEALESKSALELTSCGPQDLLLAGRKTRGSAASVSAAFLAI
jgi:hypothetical protein